MRSGIELSQFLRIFLPNISCKFKSPFIYLLQELYLKPFQEKKKNLSMNYILTVIGPLLVYIERHAVTHDVATSFPFILAQ